MSTVAWVALGANLGDREKTLATAVARLREDAFDELVVSSVYESEPWGVLDQPQFLNLVAYGPTDWKPHTLLHFFQTMEEDAGRVRGVPNGPRTLDVDLLAWGGECIHDDELTVPHPRLAERSFVLLPMVEIGAKFSHPVTGATAEEMLATLLRSEPAVPKKLGPLPLDTTNR